MARRRAAVLTCFLAFVAGSSVDALQAAGDAELRGDAAWARRAQDFARTGQVAAAPAAEAVAAYEQAWAQQGPSPRLAAKLVDALWFRGHFVLADGPAARPLFDRAVQVAEIAVDETAGSGGTAEAAAHFWAAIAWGVWGMDHGYFASALRNVAGRIRDHAEIVVQLDDRYAAAGGLRVLGRLHTVTPRLPLFTSWIDPAGGIGMLERAVALSTADPRNQLFLAEALLQHQPQRRSDAIGLLEQVAARTPSPEEWIEQSESITAARKRIAEMQEKPAPP